MYLPILSATLAIVAVQLSSAAVIRQNDLAPSNPSASHQRVSTDGNSSPLLLHAMSTARPEVEQTHTVSNSDKTVLTAGDSEIMNQIDQSFTSKTSPSANEVIDEVNQTYGFKHADERAVTQVNQVHDYAQGQGQGGVNDVYVKDETETVFAVDNPQGEREMVGTSKSNTGEQISNPDGVDHTFFVAEDHGLHQVENKDGLEVNGKSETDLVYMAGTPDDVESFYQLNNIDQHNLVRDEQGVEKDTKQSSLTGFGYTDKVTETLALDGTQNTIRINNNGVQASVGVDKTNGLYNSIDDKGNKDVLLIDDTAHNINLKDGDIGVSLSTKDMNDIFGFKDQDGTVGAYEGNGTDHSLTITDGLLTANFDLNNADELFGTSTPDGIDDVHKINQAGKSVMLDDGERGVAVGVNEIDAVHGLFDNGDVQATYQSNQVDKVLAVAEGSSGSSLQTSEMNGVLQVKDDEGKMQVISTGGQMVSQAVVIGDDQLDGNYEAGQVEELFWMGSVEAPDVDNYHMSETSLAPDTTRLSTSRPEENYQMSESPLVLEMTGLSTPREEHQTPDVIIIQQGVTLNQDDHKYRGSDAHAETATSALNSFHRLVNKFDQLYEVGDLGRIGSIFGGGRKSKVDVQVTINMEI
ncbi:uncharacterized protein LOC107048594 [Diachasma alloeum]|uniref:uncharacterized protein LOC107048594 n=1 Tax=Diachasma alloeum TaxID=454923 RepID=UPI00073827F0|nr:uncharacterized protein LOC107048594 [Diachasma alloeum]